ncbi:hypothetical protein AAFF_G00385470 [Aldrovandia affinis]|uniref:Uncharacterized protein n=1 Tax=Aldrovandia affinis TaxID=143900 RepID=A0AAD7SH32_9TELE|nr:hypothetical protein AAFF_G00385470 [Aldrovandia affinis]
MSNADNWNEVGAALSWACRGLHREARVFPARPAALADPSVPQTPLRFAGEGGAQRHGAWRQTKKLQTENKAGTEEDSGQTASVVSEPSPVRCSRKCTVNAAYGRWSFCCVHEVEEELATCVQSERVRGELKLTCMPSASDGGHSPRREECLEDCI